MMNEKMKGPRILFLSKQEMFIKSLIGAQNI